MSKAVVATRPNHDLTTRYLSAWADSVLDVATAKGYRVTDLKAKRATKRELTGVIAKTRPNFVWLNGHGGAGHVGGQDDEVLVQANHNESVLAHATVYAVACQSGRELGPRAIEEGTKAYLGYIEDFIFVTTKTKQTRPLDDETARLFFEPSNQVPLSLLKGNTAEAAHERARAMFRKNMRKLLTDDVDPEESSLLRYLAWDMQHLVVLGDPETTL